MTATVAVAKSQTLLFDTGPLWELVLYAAVRDLRFESLRGELTHLREESSYKKFTEFIAAFRRKTTTPHVVAEISSKIVRMKPRKGQEEIWELVYTEFSNMRMDEGVLRLLEMPQGLVAKIGAVDVSVLKLGFTPGQPKSCVISTDSMLIAECKRAGLDALNLWEVIAV